MCGGVGVGEGGGGWGGRGFVNYTENLKSDHLQNFYHTNLDLARFGTVWSCDVCCWRRRKFWTMNAGQLTRVIKKNIKQRMENPTTFSPVPAMFQLGFRPV